MRPVTLISTNIAAQCNNVINGVNNVSSLSNVSNTYRAIFNNNYLKRHSTAPLLRNAAPLDVMIVSALTPNTLRTAPTATAAHGGVMS